MKTAALALALLTAYTEASPLTHAKALFLESVSP